MKDNNKVTYNKSTIGCIICGIGTIAIFVLGIFLGNLPTNAPENLFGIMVLPILFVIFMTIFWVGEKHD